MTPSFLGYRDAAMALLTSGADLRRNEGQFLGGLAFSDGPLSHKQRRWLDMLLTRHSLPPVVDQLMTPIGRA